MVAKRKPEPIRKRLTIPQVNESVLAWFELQDDASASMRLLIQESIQRDGYIDIINRPVGQLPRRGRPPAEGVGPSGPVLTELAIDAGEDDEGIEDPEESATEQEESAAAQPTQEAPAKQVEKTEPEKPADSPATKTQKNEPAAEPELEDIFGSMRD